MIDIHGLSHFRQAGGRCDHAKLSRVEIGGICDACGDTPKDGLNKYLMRGCDCGIEVFKWCSDVLRTPWGRQGFLGDLRGARARFMDRRNIRDLPEAEKRQRWKARKVERYQLRLRRLEVQRAARVARASTTT